MKTQGVTFLAYGNGAPDIFCAVAGLVNGNRSGNLALSALVGECIGIKDLCWGLRGHRDVTARLYPSKSLVGFSSTTFRRTFVKSKSNPCRKSCVYIPTSMPSKWS